VAIDRNVTIRVVNPWPEALGAARDALARAEWLTLSPFQRALRHAAPVVDDSNNRLRGQDLRASRRCTAHFLDIQLIRFLSEARRQGGRAGLMLAVDFMSDHPDGGTLDQALEWPRK